MRRIPRTPVAGTPIGGILCAVSVLAAILIAHPYAEIPISDDFSYVRSAQVLAQTGHIAYNGWAAASLGSQLYLAALFIKLFGFSFTAVRASIMLVTVVTAYLSQRTLVRAGVNEWNASIATLALLLSPLCMPMEVTFMSDIPGLFAIILCLYACLRAIQSHTARSAIAWIGFAAVSNAIFGSARQIAWLGVLVIVPSALWILRRRRSVFLAGAAFWIVSASAALAMNHWVKQQPYTHIELLVPARITRHFVYQLTCQMTRAFFEVALFVLPVLLMFLPSLYRKKHPWQVYALSGLFVVEGLYLWRTNGLHLWYAPYLPGLDPSGFPARARPSLTIAVALGVLALLAAVLSRKDRLPSPTGSAAPLSRRDLSDRKLMILILPFTLAYLGLLLPRAGSEIVWDRYVIPLLFVALLFLLRFYQQRFRPRLPVVCLLLTLCFAAFAVASMHDQLAMFRARAVAIQEVLATGVPPTSITGGWTYDGWTELQHSDHLNAAKMRWPAGAVPPVSTHYGIDNCPWWYCDMFPHVVPRYAISSRSDAGLANTFAPVPYSTWVDPAGTVYIVRFPHLPHP